jgi:hypothetical protein
VDDQRERQLSERFRFFDRRSRVERRHRGRDEAAVWTRGHYPNLGAVAIGVGREGDRCACRLAGDRSSRVENVVELRRGRGHRERPRRKGDADPRGDRRCDDRDRYHDFDDREPELLGAARIPHAWAGARFTGCESAATPKVLPPSATFLVEARGFGSAKPTPRT